MRNFLDSMVVDEFREKIEFKRVARKEASRAQSLSENQATGIVTVPRFYFSL